MEKVTNFQIYSILTVTAIPIAFLIAPGTLFPYVANAAWLAVLAAIIPGLAFILILLYIFKKSPQPFPVILENCLGKSGGKIVGFCYSVVFMLVASVNLALFLYFVESNVLPRTPISVFIFAMLVSALYGIKKGFTAIARICEIIVLIGLPFTLLMLFLSFQQPDFRNLLPLAHVSCQPFIKAVAHSFRFLSQMFIILILASYCTRPRYMPGTLLKSLVTYVVIIGLTALIPVLIFGEVHASSLSFPTFKMVRLISIGNFIKNLDALFIAVWFSGVFGTVLFKWFLACYFTQQVFGLKDYRFLAAPSSIIIGFTAILVSSNIIELEILYAKIVPILFTVFFVIVPVILFVILLFKPYPDKTLTGTKSDALE